MCKEELLEKINVLIAKLNKLNKTKTNRMLLDTFNDMLRYISYESIGFKDSVDAIKNNVTLICKKLGKEVAYIYCVCEIIRLLNMKQYKNDKKITDTAEIYKALTELISKEL